MDNFERSNSNKPHLVTETEHADVYAVRMSELRERGVVIFPHTVGAGLDPVTHFPSLVLNGVTKTVNGEPQDDQFVYVSIDDNNELLRTLQALFSLFLDQESTTILIEAVVAMAEAGAAAGREAWFHQELTKNEQAVRDAGFDVHEP